MNTKNVKTTMMLTAVLAMMSVSLNAQTTWNIGTPTATALTATLSGGTLTINGTGAMQDFPSYDAVPWYSVRNSITSLVINSGVTSIGNYAFRDCGNITSALNLPNTITVIGDYAFYNCLKLPGTLNIPNVITIGSNAFYNCLKLTGALTLPATLTSLGNDAFYSCSGLNGTLTIPNSITAIPDDAFMSCSGLTGGLTIPNTVTSIGSSAFMGCKSLTGTLTIPDLVTSIGPTAFSGCRGLTGALTIPNAVKTIGFATFNNCVGLTSLIAGNSVTVIEYNAFSNCTGLTSVTVPSTIVKIGDYCFSACTGLQTFTCLNVDTVKTMGTSIFSGVTVSACTLKVPAGSEAKYSKALQWKDFGSIVGISTAIESVQAANPLRAWVENGVLHVSGLTAGETWNVYNAAGGCIYTNIAGADLQSVPMQTHGVYIVKQGNNAVKVVY